MNYFRMRFETQNCFPEFQIDIFENCKFVKKQRISVQWTDNNPSNMRYGMEMKPVGMTGGIID